jgi:hypothetical protein
VTSAGAIEALSKPGPFNHVAVEDHSPIPYSHVAAHRLDDECVLAIFHIPAELLFRFENRSHLVFGELKHSSENSAIATEKQFAIISAKHRPIVNENSG